MTFGTETMPQDWRQIWYGFSLFAQFQQRTFSLFGVLKLIHQLEDFVFVDFVCLYVIGVHGNTHHVTFPIAACGVEIGSRRVCAGCE
jgi:hypothetical protein